MAHFGNALGKSCGCFLPVFKDPMQRGELQYTRRTRHQSVSIRCKRALCKCYIEKMIYFNSKTLMAFLLIGCMAFIADSFTPGRIAGMLLDAKLIYLKSLALGSFTRFLLNGRFPLLFGRKKRETPALEQETNLEMDRNTVMQAALQAALEAEKYLILAEALDGDKCVQLSICMAMANANKGNLTEVEQVFVESFRSENSTLEMEQNVLGESVPVHHSMFPIAPPQSYVEAANIGETSQSGFVCRKSYTACKLTDEDLKKVAVDAKNVF